ncbi:putative AAA+ ATPase domain, ATPase, AAA-type, core, AAA-type ATPase domain-containing protein [Helianthus annuus]|nr:putative AAA+ ATPase domain, ATPase, AAA-type, core, AAA-type ATPase domain-containing protein [Helianthus annuus]
MTSSSPESKTPTLQTLISTVGSVATAAMVARTLLPSDFQDYLYSGFCNFINKLSRHLTMVIYEFDGVRENEIYNAAEIYLATRVSHDIHRVKVNKNPSDNNITVAMEINEKFTDVYNGVKFHWSLSSKKFPSTVYYSDDGYGSRSTNRSTQQRSFELTFHRKHTDLVLNHYFPFILNVAETKKRERKTVKIFTVDYNQLSLMMPVSQDHPVWTSVSLDHPATFATLAMDADVKETVMNDLNRFVERREYYRRVGKAWKRGYLLYGPPGTGKSSLIAAMANYLNFDIYDLELADLTNSMLRQLLMATANRSILVVEDVDCSVELHDRAGEDAVTGNRPQGYRPEHRVTLSGFLNFIDGLWSSCGDERIIVFTTNRKEKLDPALLRPGRMDVHINMSYCTPCGFRLLASNYHGITQHERFEEIDDLIGKVEITPAEVAEQLLRDDDADRALGGLVEFFNVKMQENEEAKAKEIKVIK